MKLSRQHRFEKILYSILTGAIGLAVGYYWAASTAADMVREGLR